MGSGPRFQAARGGGGQHLGSGLFAVKTHWGRGVCVCGGGGAGSTLPLEPKGANPPMIQGNRVYWLQINANPHHIPSPGPQVSLC